MSASNTMYHWSATSWRWYDASQVLSASRVFWLRKNYSHLLSQPRGSQVSSYVANVSLWYLGTATPSGFATKEPPVAASTGETSAW
jgi:hypothetical protein